MKILYKLLTILVSILAIGSIRSMDNAETEARGAEIHVAEARGLANWTRIDRLDVRGSMKVTIPDLPGININRTTHIHNNQDFTGGNPDATLWQQIRNAACKSIPSLVYGLPSDTKHIVVSVATMAATTLVSLLIRDYYDQHKQKVEVNQQFDKQERGLRQIASIDQLIIAFTKKMVQLSSSCEEYTRYKQNIEKLKARKDKLEEEFLQKMYENLTEESFAA